MQGEYSELVLRQKLFAFSVDFFMLRKDSEIKGLMSISLPVHPKEFGATLRLVICPKKFLNDLFQYSRDYFPYLAVRDVSKIGFYEASSEPVSKKFLLEKSFEKDLVIYSLPYTQDFIKKVKEQRKKFA